MCNIAKEKAALRRILKDKRDKLPNRDEKSRLLCRSALQQSAVLAADTVFLYLSFGSEPDTLPLLTALLSEGKRVAVPLCDPRSHTMEAVEIHGLSDLAAGAYGILEPRLELLSEGKCRILPKSEISVIFVPGLAFDKEGYRLGYGGGYYDRYLKDFQGTSIGLTFSECLTDRLPREACDQAADLVLCEKDGEKE